MKRSQQSLEAAAGCSPDCSNFTCPNRQLFEPLAGAERLVGMGFRCWISGYQTGDIRSWERGWCYFAKELGPEKAKIAVTELTGWARSICCHAEREINVCEYGHDDFSQDECIAVSMIAACQHNACPALEACTYALLGASSVDPVVNSTNRFAHALDSASIRLADSVIASGVSYAPASVGIAAE